MFFPGAYIVFKYYQAFITISVTTFHPRYENDNSLILFTFFLCVAGLFAS